MFFQEANLIVGWFVLFTQKIILKGKSQVVLFFPSSCEVFFLKDRSSFAGHSNHILGKCHLTYLYESQCSESSILFVQKSNLAMKIGLSVVMLVAGLLLLVFSLRVTLLKKPPAKRIHSQYSKPFCRSFLIKCRLFWNEREQIWRSG